MLLKRTANTIKYYCSQGCAEGHKTIKGCSHTGCGC
ncbi:hypothetical protein [Nostoc sp.]